MRNRVYYSSLFIHFVSLRENRQGEGGIRKFSLYVFDKLPPDAFNVQLASI